MSSVVISGNTSGTITLDAPAVAGTTVLTLPATTGTVITTGNIPTGSVLQVVSTNKVDTFSTTSASFTDVTGLSASITPSSASNKVLVFISVQYSLNGEIGALRVTRGGTPIGGGTAVGSRPSALAQTSGENNNNWNDSTVTTAKYILDSPSSTSSLTYQVQILTNGTRYINRTNADNDNNSGARTSSQIILMEIKG
jgi:hypothetical protein